MGPVRGPDSPQPGDEDQKLLWRAESRRDLSAGGERKVKLTQVQEVDIEKGVSLEPLRSAPRLLFREHFEVYDGDMNIKKRRKNKIK